MAHMGHPLLGDDLYDIADGFPRHALHAAALTFPSPTTGESMTVSAPLPADMMAVIETLGKEVAELAFSQTSPKKCE
jgi:23S rRNA pseudouridine1911/1915/1917 synthase